MCACFFTYFLYVGTHSPYLSLYLSDQGLSVAQIGLILSLAPATRLVGPMFWGGLADRTGARVLIMRVCALIALFALAALVWAGGAFVWVAVFATILFLANSGTVPINEAIALEASGGVAARYARMRLWGSIGFIVAVLGMAPVLESLGTASLPWWLAAMMIALLGATWLIPAAEAVRPGAGGARGQGSVWLSLRDPKLLAFFASLFLMIYAHGAFYAFFSLFLEHHGYGKPAIGMLWAVGVIAEIGIFYFARPLFERFSPLSLLGFSMVVAVLRFALVGWSDGSLAVIAVTQVLHAVTFGVHHGATQALLQRWFDPSRQASAQGLFSTIAYGMGGTLGGLGASALWVSWAPEAAFFGAAVAAGFGVLAVWACARSARADPARL